MKLNPEKIILEFYLLNAFVVWFVHNCRSTDYFNTSADSGNTGIVIQC